MFVHCILYPGCAVQVWVLGKLLFVRPEDVDISVARLRGETGQPGH